MPVSTLDPIDLTCNRCGTTWPTRSRLNAKCPQCGTTRRVHRGNASVRTSGQVSEAPAPARPSVPRPARPAPRAPSPPSPPRPTRPAPVQAEVLERHDEYPPQISREAMLELLPAIWRGKTSLPEVFSPDLPPRALITDDRNTIVGSVAAIISRRHGRRHSDPCCARCGARPGYNTPGLYRVASPALDAIGQSGIVLCHMHAVSEFVPGTGVVPL